MTCSTSVPTRVYTAIASEPELSSAIPDLGLHWLGVKEGYAFITSAAPEQPVSIHALPLSINTAAFERPITVDLDLASHGLLAEHPRFVVYNPLTDAVLESDNWGFHQLHLSLGSSGGSCVVSPVYTLPTSKLLPVGKATWGIAYLTPHTHAHATEQEQEEEDSDAEPEAEPEAKPETETSNLEYDSDTDYLNHEIKPPPKRRLIPSAVYNPRRTVEFLIPLIWRTMGYLVRALIMRLFTMIGLPASPFLAHRRSMFSSVASIQPETRAGPSGSISTDAEPTKVAESEFTEKVEAAGSDSATEVASSVGGERPAQVFTVPKGPLSLLVHTVDATNNDMGGDEKVRSLLPEVTLAGERVTLDITPLGHGWAIVRANGDVRGGRVEVYGTPTST